MNYSLKRYRKLSALLLCLLLSGCGSSKMNSSSDYVLVTAAHIPESYYPEYEQVYVEPDKDVAVYINKEYKPDIPKKEDTVYIDNVKGKVIDTDDYGCYIELDDLSIVKQGLSGTRVFSADNLYIGFVSACNKDKVIYCLCF